MKEAYLHRLSVLRILDLGVVHARAFWSRLPATRATSQWPAAAEQEVVTGKAEGRKGTGEGRADITQTLGVLKAPQEP